MKRLFVLVTGVFIGNFLMVPLIFERTFKDGFFIGILAAIIIVIIHILFKRIKKNINRLSQNTKG
jgi:hypothetical protein